MVSEIVLFSCCCCCLFWGGGFWFGGIGGGCLLFVFVFGWERILRHGLVYGALVDLKLNYIDQAGFKLVASASAFMLLGLQSWAPLLARTKPFSSPSELNSSYLALITATSSTPPLGQSSLNCRSLCRFLRIQFTWRLRLCLPYDVRIELSTMAHTCNPTLQETTDCVS